MKVFSLFLKLLCLLFLFLFLNLGHAKLEVIWIDVEQGDACFSKISQVNIRVPGLVVDSGSSKNSSGRKTTIKNNIITTLSSFFSVDIFLRKETDALPDLYVIVTHGDEDHLYFVTDVITELEGRMGRSLDIRFFLGGKKDDYCKKNKEGLKFFNYVKHRTSHPDYRYGPFLREDMSSSPTSFDFGDTTSLSILSALVTEDKNTNSVVSKFVHGSTSVLFTGDATQDTTDAAKSSIPSASTTLMQLAHHGSSTHGSNPVDWFEIVNAMYYSCSSGITPYKHPHGGAFANFFGSRLASPTAFYLVKFSEGGDIPFSPDAYPGLCIPLGRERHYTYAAVRMPLFSTIVQGNLKFVFDDAGTLESLPVLGKTHSAVKLPAPLSQPLSTKDVLQYYITTSKEAVTLNNLDFAILKEVKVEILAASDLKRLSLAGNHLGQDLEHLDYIKEIISHTTTLEEFNLMSNNFSPEEQREIQSAWGEGKAGLLFS